MMALKIGTKLIGLAALLFVSCMNGEKNPLQNTAGIDEGNNNLTAIEKTSNTEKIPKLKYFYNTDSRNGMVTERIPFPKEWQQHKGGEFAFTGPNGIKVYADGGRFFSYTNDPTLLQLYHSTGINVKYPLTMDQAIDEFLVSQSNTINRKMVKKYPISQLMEFYKTFDSMLFKVEENPKQFQATAIEWEDPDGTRWITVFNYQIEQGNNTVNWGFQAGAMGAPAQYFETAKQDYLNGLLNRQINPQWLSFMNKQSEYTIRKSNAAHAQREAAFKRGVAERQKQWEANQDFIANRQRNWEAGLEARSKTQEHIADVLLGKTNIIDPETGDKSKIDHTNNHYWVNSKNEYVGIDESYVDPNKSAFLNNRTWREFKIDDYK